MSMRVRERLSLTEHSQLLSVLLLFSDPLLSVPTALPHEVGVVFLPCNMEKMQREEAPDAQHPENRKEIHMWTLSHWF